MSFAAKRFVLFVVFMSVLQPGLGLAQIRSKSGAASTERRSMDGTVEDPLGAAVPNATVEVMNESGTVIATSQTGADGHYQIRIAGGGRYRLRVMARSFETSVTPLRFFRGNADVHMELTLATPTLTQEVTVTATGVPTPLAQVGAAVSVLTLDDFRYQPEVQDPLRTVPGLQVTQTGTLGGTTGLYIRGGNTNANKVLIDGVPANDIGGAVEFGNIDAVGIEKIEVLREPNSALYGSDALAGVVSLTTARGTTRYPLFAYTGSGGNFGTYRNEVEASGVVRSFDYYSAFARMDTHGNQRNDAFHDGTYAGNFGWSPNAANELRFTVRHLTESGAQPNAISLYGIADAAGETEHDSYYSGLWNNHPTYKWHNQVRYGGLRLNYLYTDYAATGIYNNSSDVYLGAPVTIQGANGYSVRGQALFQYGASYGSEYPNTYSAPSKRDFMYAQTDYAVSPKLIALGAFKYEAERGATVSSPSFGATPPISRGNYSYTLQVAGAFKRLYYTLGSGLEDNGLFGFAATPRASLAYYLRAPSGTNALGGTKLHFSFGKGIKEPSIYYQSISLYGTLQQLPNGSALIAQYHVAPIGPEDSRTYDGGVDQEFWHGKARVGVTYFHNEFTNVVEFVPQSALIALGFAVAKNVAALQYGAAVNSQAFRSQGIEVEGEYRIDRHLFARAGYTYLDAVIQQSFSSDAVPVYNTSSNFSTVPIGQFSPLKGARPFRRAPHSGYFGLNYTRSKFSGTLTGSLVGKRDDSDFLYDASFGSSLLLPNRNLLGSYQRLDLGAGYEVTRRVSAFLQVQNLLSEHYFEAFGFPSLPLAFRAGLRLSFGGDSWKLN